MARWPFTRRKKIQPNLPPEVQQYYQAENKGRMGMAWLIAGLSLLVSVLILATLFLAGRWAYRQITGNDKQNETTQTTSDTPKEEAKESTPEKQGGDLDVPVPAPAPTPTPAPQPTPAPVPTPDPALVRTGPDLDL